MYEPVSPLRLMVLDDAGYEHDIVPKEQDHAKGGTVTLVPRPRSSHTLVTVTADWPEVMMVMRSNLSAR